MGNEKYVIDIMGEGIYNINFGKYDIINIVDDSIVYFICPLKIYHRYDKDKEGFTLDEYLSLNTNYFDTSSMQLKQVLNIRQQLINEQKIRERDKKIKKLLK